MNVLTVVSICVGASVGSLIRWWLGLSLNSIFPTMPLGTFAANVLGGLFIGMFITITKSYPFIPEVARLFIVTGFLGGLTTFSTFSAETATLFLQQEYMWSLIIVLLHVAGSFLATIFGMYIMKVCMF